MKDKKQVGRPPFNKGANRVPFNCMVKPAIRALLNKWGDVPGLSPGLVIDDLVEERQAKLDYDSQG